MSILNKLLEKKDLASYIEFRIDYLNSIKTKTIMDQPERKRGLVAERFEGRIAELQKLKNLLCQDKIKDMSKEYFTQINSIKPDNVEM